MKKRGFTPLEIKFHLIKTRKYFLWKQGLLFSNPCYRRPPKGGLSLTGFTPLETMERQGRDSMSLTGFTLVEIMIVVTIIALLAAIAIPSVIRARLNANESAVIAVLKTIVSGCTSFTSVNSANYPLNFAAMSGAVPPYIDPSFVGAPVKMGYTFTYVPLAAANPNLGFHVIATPVTRGTTGSRDFYVDEAGVICASPANTAGATVAHTGGTCTAPDAAVQ